jgi:hypothetical protein
MPQINNTDEELLRLHGHFMALQSSPAWSSVDLILKRLEDNAKELLVAGPISQIPNVHQVRGYIAGLRALKEAIGEIERGVADYHKRKELEDRKSLQKRGSNFPQRPAPELDGDILSRDRTPRIST